MFTPLARGRGSWSGELELDLYVDLDKEGTPSLPVIGTSDSESGQKIGTIRRPKGTPTVLTQSSQPESQDGKLELPKTYITRSGALFLFTAPSNVELSEQQKRELRQGLSQIRNTELKTKFGTLSKFTKSVLNYGSEEHPDDKHILSEETQPLFLHLPPGHDASMLDVKSRPGGDFALYLHDLKSRTISTAGSTCGAPSYLACDRPSVSPAGSQCATDYIDQSQMLSADADRLVEQYLQSPMDIPLRTPLDERLSAASPAGSQRSHKVLSSERLTASLKSATYLGRPSSQASYVLHPNTPASREASFGGHQLHPDSAKSRPASGQPRLTPISPKPSLPDCEPDVESYYSGGSAAGSYEELQQFVTPRHSSTSQYEEMYPEMTDPTQPLKAGYVVGGGGTPMMVDSNSSFQISPELQRGTDPPRETSGSNQNDDVPSMISVEIRSRRSSIASSHSGVPSEHGQSSVLSGYRPASADGRSSHRTDSRQRPPRDGFHPTPPPHPGSDADANDSRMPVGSSARNFTSHRGSIISTASPISMNSQSHLLNPSDILLHEQECKWFDSESEDQRGSLTSQIGARRGSKFDGSSYHGSVNAETIVSNDEFVRVNSEQDAELAKLEVMSTDDVDDDCFTAVTDVDAADDADKSVWRDPSSRPLSHQRSASITQMEYSEGIVCSSEDDTRQGDTLDIQRGGADGSPDHRTSLTRQKNALMMDTVPEEEQRSGSDALSNEEEAAGLAIDDIILENLHVDSDDLHSETVTMANNEDAHPQAAGADAVDCNSQNRSNRRRHKVSRHSKHSHKNSAKMRPNVRSSDKDRTDDVSVAGDDVSETVGMDTRDSMEPITQTELIGSTAVEMEASESMAAPVEAIKRGRKLKTKKPLLRKKKSDMNQSEAVNGSKAALDDDDTVQGSGIVTSQESSGKHMIESETSELSPTMESEVKQKLTEESPPKPQEFSTSLESATLLASDSREGESHVGSNEISENIRSEKEKEKEKLDALMNLSVGLMANKPAKPKKKKTKKKHKEAPAVTDGKKEAVEDENKEMISTSAANDAQHNTETDALAVIGEGSLVMNAESGSVQEASDKSQPQEGSPQQEEQQLDASVTDPNMVSHLFLVDQQESEPSSLHGEAEIRPENLVGDTKSELQRLFGGVVPKPPSDSKPRSKSRKKKSPIKKQKELPSEAGQHEAEVEKSPDLEESSPEVTQEPEAVQEPVEEDAQQPPTEAESNSPSVDDENEEQDSLSPQDAPTKTVRFKTEKSAKVKGRMKEKIDPAKERENARLAKQKEIQPTRKVSVDASNEEALERKRRNSQRRLEEARQIQEKIKVKEKEVAEREAKMAKRKNELEEELSLIAAEADSYRQSEEEARAMLAAARRTAREEREARRRADLERKKQEAQRRREEERRVQEEARRREQEMLNRLSSADDRRKQVEEDERLRREEEEWEIEQERIQDEERLRTMAEEEEEKFAELERQAEEEAMARLVKEREETEERRRKLEEEARMLMEEEERDKERMLEEARQLEEMQHIREEQELEREWREKKRLEEIRRIEEEAREKMKQELEQRRQTALRRREVNIDRKRNLDRLKDDQDRTRPYVFSYYVHWPREKYERPMGKVDNAKRPATRTKSASSKAGKTPVP